jgi:hypothetical protein
MTKNAKYKFTNPMRTTPTGVVLHQTQALHDINERVKMRNIFSDIPCPMVGDLGGRVASESNLDIHDKSWVFGDAQVEEAKVFGKAWISGEEKV